MTAEIGLIGGSGLYALAGVAQAREVVVDTPFGPPSDALVVGEIAGRRVAFLARHGRGHRLLPHEINYRANVWAMKALGVSRILSASAVGSLRETVEPRHVMTPDQFVDRTRGRAATFFGQGIAVHVGFADPVCAELRTRMAEEARNCGAVVHAEGTYLCMEGPAFSTRAESHLYRAWGMDVIGMTNLTEAKLAREAEICYATLALVTDYDCWHEEEDDVTVDAILETLQANARLAAEVLARTVATLPEERGCSCGRALDGALATARAAISPEVRMRLAPILARVLA
ncbi:MAG TPA: S-methyl-5'-thioadenosine phosphorylase [Candidatus Polarisedimenticolaceae bacterium]|nr:S-methyl-5'-thioadenosine phosphorylase [Candidatus Polarisedimenticolaceae bacterium]